MNSSVIGKIEKARIYAGERHRVHFKDLEIEFKGDNGDHTLGLRDEHWHCNCDFFAGHGACAHTMAMERILEGMLPSTVSMSLQHA